ncbi:MAG: hypothetical protein R2823_03265 [Acidimicrobiia bacterium]
MTDQTTPTYPSPVRTTNWRQAVVLAIAFAIAAGTAAVALIMNGGGDEALAAPQEPAPTTTVVEAAAPTTTMAATTTTEPAEAAPEAPAPAPAPEPAPAPAPEPAPAPAPAPAPDPAHLEAPSDVDLGVATSGTIVVGNTGDEPLTITGISSDSPHISFGPAAGVTVAGGASHAITLTVDTTPLASGAYSILAGLSTDAGDKVVHVTGFKPFMIDPLFPLDPIVPIGPWILVDYNITVDPTTITMGHNVGFSALKVTNNEAFDVTLTIDESYDRLSIADEFVLSPGTNFVWLTVDPRPVGPLSLSVMNIDLTWLGGSETVRVFKFGS